VKSTTARIGILLVATLVAASCSGDDDSAATTTVAPTTTIAPTTSTTTSTTTTTTTTEPEDEDEVVLRMPLTGEPVTDAEMIPDRPALAVKIDNHPTAKPQAGLNEADLVFEEIVEFGTRFAAVFHSQGSDPVGPVRSGRSQDVGILSSLAQPLFAWSGGNPGVRQIVRDSDLIDLDAGFSSGYYRRSGVGGAPHNLFSSTDALWESTPEEYTIPPQQFPYLLPGDSLDGQPATTVNLTMGGLSVRWEYDTVTGRYLRFDRGVPHMTELTGQVSADNIVVMAVVYGRSSADPASPEAQTTGVGPVLVFSRGVMRMGFWSRPTIHDPYVLSFDEPVLVEAGADDSDDGDTDTADTDTDAADEDDSLDTDDELELIGLVPGRSWIELAELAENFVTWE
jgi:hypothetical protein